MGVGAIGSMSVSGYIYNPNRVTSKSLDKVQRISDDVLDGKLDVQNEMSQENENPLKILLEKHKSLNIFCPTCYVQKRPKVKHCFICDKCVDGFHHHCFWLNTW